MIIGVSLAAPVGPIGVLIMQRTLVHGRTHALLSGLGVASADAVYAAIATFGLTLLSNFLLSLNTPVRLVGGLFLLYLGIRTLVAVPVPRELTAASGAERAGGRGAYLSALALTIANPMTILLFTGIFAGANLSSTDPVCAIGTVGGVFSGSMLWWLSLTTVVSLVRTHLTERWLLWINRVSGGIIIAFALMSLIGLLISS
ncbi:MAG: LysE/ArgO family amino acid transporter [Candidatus Flexifilum sp.]